MPDDAAPSAPEMPSPAKSGITMTGSAKDAPPKPPKASVRERFEAYQEKRDEVRLEALKHKRAREAERYKVTQAREELQQDRLERRERRADLALKAERVKDARREVSQRRSKRVKGYFQSMPGMGGGGGFNPFGASEPKRAPARRKAPRAPTATVRFEGAPRRAPARSSAPRKRRSKEGGDPFGLFGGRGGGGFNFNPFG